MVFLRRKEMGRNEAIGVEFIKDVVAACFVDEYL
jgi:hypothetical protein